jgi:hypothetical protein
MKNSITKENEKQTNKQSYNFKKPKKKNKIKNIFKKSNKIHKISLLPVTFVIKKIKK